MAPLDERIRSLSDGIDRLVGKRAGLQAQRDALGRHQGLLWLAGLPLEHAVREALAVLGITARPNGGPRKQVDLVVARPDGGELFIEVEGTETTQVPFRKGQQLLSYVQMALDEIKPLPSGAIVANPFRLRPPEARPAPDADDENFTPPLVDLAKQQRWPLLTTRHLFDWVNRALAGDPDASREARSALGLEDG